MSTLTVGLASLSDFMARCLHKGGFSEDTAAQVSEHLLEAEMCGVHSHGVVRMAYYLDLVRAGELNPSTVSGVYRRDQAFWSVDGGGGLGIPAMNLAVDCLIESCKSSSVAAVAITNVGHTGRIGAFTARAARQGLFAMCLGGGGGAKWANVAPFGGIDPVIHTNPYSLAVADGTDQPPYVDLAVSAIATGKVTLAATKGELVPEGTLIDRNGLVTRDPNALVNGGALLPAAGPKGSGLGIIAELVGGAMLGSAFELNWLMLAVRADALRDDSAVYETNRAFATSVRASRPAQGHSSVQMPGDAEYTNSERARQRGTLDVGVSVVDRLRAAGALLGEELLVEGIA